MTKSQVACQALEERAIVNEQLAQRVGRDSVFFEVLHHQYPLLSHLPPQYLIALLEDAVHEVYQVSELG
jgi:hypothetical protein